MGNILAEKYGFKLLCQLFNAIFFLYPKVSGSLPLLAIGKTTC